MKSVFLTIAASLMALSSVADDYDQNKPFGFCTVSSRTDASVTYDITGGGCYTYPVPDGFTGKVIPLKSTGLDMKGTIQNAIKQNDVIILDGADGPFYVSSNVGVTASNKTIIGINNARICTMWYVTDEIKAALDAAEVLKKSTSSGTGGQLTNGETVSEARELATRQTIINTTGDNSENYRQSGCISLINCQNIIIRNIAFQGPGAVDVSGSDLLSVTGAKHIWVDHCSFQDGMDGNFDITNSADFNTVSWCTFSYSNRSYDHRNTNLVGSSDSEATGYLNTTFAFNWWGTACNQRMPMARVGKIHMMNNYFSSTTASNCINPRKNSEFLIDGNYFAAGVKNYYSQKDAIAVTWTPNNYITESSNLPSSLGTTVTVPYAITAAPYSDVPDLVMAYAGPTLGYGDGSGEPTGVKGSVTWVMSGNTNAAIGTSVENYLESPSLTLGSNLSVMGYGTYSNTRFCKVQAEEPLEAADESNKVVFSFKTKAGYKFLATQVSLDACRCGTGNGNFDIYWEDAGGPVELKTGEGPNKNESTPFSYDVSAKSTATDGTCSLVMYLYNIKYAESGGEKTYKQMGLANVLIQGFVLDVATGIATPVSLSTPVATEVYNMAGQRVGDEARGLVILRQRMADGTVKSVKVIR